LHEETVDLGKEWGRDLLEGQAVRSGVMHSIFGEPLPRVTKQELDRYTKAVFAYFEELHKKLPKSFQYVGVLLDQNEDLRDKISLLADAEETGE
jgi:hypothetical protein